jgi:hypothetical protein
MSIHYNLQDIFNITSNLSLICKFSSRRQKKIKFEEIVKSDCSCHHLVSIIHA